jgi:uncharacterized protein YcaQ
LSIAQARRIALAAQGLAAARPKAPKTWGALERTIRKINLLQIDSVNVLCRSHYLPLFSRLGAYAQDVLDRRTLARQRRRVFEYWAHEASFLPLDLYPLMRWRMRRSTSGKGISKHLYQFSLEQKDYCASVLREVRARGPLTVSDLSDPGERSGNWWGWSKGKMALEHLFDAGLVTTSERQSFERFYDVTERVIPASVLDAPELPEETAIRQLAELSARALGVATEADIRDYFRLPPAESQKAVAQLVEAKLLIPVAVEGWKQQAYLHADAKLPRRAEAQALVSPFDPIVWERKRAERLFDFRYRIEIYTPAPKRVYGYYVLPFLMGERFAARLCLKADRQAGLLKVNAAHLEEPADAAETAAALAAELQAMAQWLGLGGIATSPSGAFAKRLAKLTA